MKSLIVLLSLMFFVNMADGQNPVAYQDINYEGKSANINGSCMNFANQNYCDVYWDNQISSIYVPEGWVLELYDQIDYEGNQYNLYKSVPDLRTIGWNDVIKSIKVVGPNGAYLSGVFWPGCISKPPKEKEPKTKFMDK